MRNITPAPTTKTADWMQKKFRSLPSVQMHPNSGENGTFDLNSTADLKFKVGFRSND
jgi:hypothetical protein